MSPRIDVHRLRVDYRRATALSEVTFTLDGPKIYGLLGRNGSGKTSLLSVLAGFRRTTGGEVRLDGEPVYENPRAAGRICLIRGSGDAPDSDWHWPWDRVAHALEHAALLRPSWDAGYAAELLDRFELAPKQRLAELSRGRRAAVGAVLGLASRAPVTAFDETSLGMDAPTRQMFYDAILADFMAHPRAFVLSSHLIEEVSPLVEEVLMLDRGGLLLHEEAEALRSSGVSVTGPAEAVDRFAAGGTVLGEQSLGATKAVTLYGSLSEEQRRQAAEAGLELGPVGMQELFVHLTSSSGGSR